MGEMYALLSAACFAASNVTITRGADRDARDNGAFLSILLTAAIASLAMLVLPHPGGHRHGTAAGVAFFVASGVLTVFVGRVFLYASVQHLGAVRASAVKRLNPVFSVLLGVTLLGEPVGLSMAAGMTLIFVSFGLLAMQSWRSRHDVVASTSRRRRGVLARLGNLGYFYGPVSALAYATGYLARKQGLTAMPDPNLGTFIGAVAGALAFLLAALFIDSYRVAVRSTFGAFKPWLIAAGMMASFGQLLSFVALNTSTISRVALIGSMEVIFTMLLSVWVLGGRERMTRLTIIAALLSVLGAGLVIRP